MEEYNKINFTGITAKSPLVNVKVEQEDYLFLQYQEGNITIDTAVYYDNTDSEYNALINKKVLQNLITLNIITFDDLLSYYEIKSKESLEKNFYNSKQDFNLNSFKNLVDEEKEIEERLELRDLVQTYNDEFGLPDQLVYTANQLMSLSSGEQLLVDMLTKDNYKDLYETNKGILGEDFTNSALEIISYKDNEALKQELYLLDDINQNYLDNPLNFDDVFETIKEAGGVTAYLSDLINNYDKYIEEGADYSKEEVIDLAVRHSLDTKLSKYFEKFNNTPTNIYYENLGGVFHERDLVEVIPSHLEEEVNALGQEEFLNTYYDQFIITYSIDDLDYRIGYKVMSEDNQVDKIINETTEIIETFFKEYKLNEISSTNKESLKLDIKLGEIHREIIENNEIKNYNTEVDNLYLTAYNEVNGTFNLEIDINGIPTEWEITSNTPISTIKEYVQEHVEISDHLLMYDRVIENVENRLGKQYVEAFELVDGLIQSSGKQQELINYMMELDESNQDYVENLADTLEITESEVYDLAFEESNKDLYFASDEDLLITTKYLVMHKTVETALDQNNTDGDLNEAKQIALEAYEYWHEAEIEDTTFEEYLELSESDQTDFEKYNVLPENLKKIINQSYNLEYNIQNNLGLGSGQEQLLNFASSNEAEYSRRDLSQLDKRNSALAYLIAEEKNMKPVSSEVKNELLNYLIENNDNITYSDINIESELITTYVLENNLDDYIEENNEVQIRDFITHLQETDDNHIELRKSLLKYYDMIDTIDLANSIMEQEGQSIVEEALNTMGWDNYPSINKALEDFNKVLYSGTPFDVEEQKYLGVLMGEEGYKAVKDYINSNNIKTLEDYNNFANTNNSFDLSEDMVHRLSGIIPKTYSSSGNNPQLTINEIKEYMELSNKFSNIEITGYIASWENELEKLAPQEQADLLETTVRKIRDLDKKVDNMILNITHNQTKHNITIKDIDKLVEYGKKYQDMDNEELELIKNGNVELIEALVEEMTERSYQFLSDVTRLNDINTHQVFYKENLTDKLFNEYNNLSNHHDTFKEEINEIIQILTIDTETNNETNKFSEYLNYTINSDNLLSPQTKEMKSFISSVNDSNVFLLENEMTKVLAGVIPTKYSCAGNNPQLTLKEIKEFMFKSEKFFKTEITEFLEKWEKELGKLDIQEQADVLEVTINIIRDVSLDKIESLNNKLTNIIELDTDGTEEVRSTVYKGLEQYDKDNEVYDLLQNILLDRGLVGPELGSYYSEVIDDSKMMNEDKQKTFEWLEMTDKPENDYGEFIHITPQGIGVLTEDLTWNFEQLHAKALKESIEFTTEGVEFDGDRFDKILNQHPLKTNQALSMDHYTEFFDNPHYKEEFLEKSKWITKPQLVDAEYKLTDGEVISISAHSFTSVEYILDELNEDYIQDNQELIKNLILDFDRMYFKNEVLTLSELECNITNCIENGEFVKVPEDNYFLKEFSNEVEKLLNEDDKYVLPNGTKVDLNDEQRKFMDEIVKQLDKDYVKDNPELIEAITKAFDETQKYNFDSYMIHDLKASVEDGKFTKLKYDQQYFAEFHKEVSKQMPATVENLDKLGYSKLSETLNYLGRKNFPQVAEAKIHDKLQYDNNGNLTNEEEYYNQEYLKILYDNEEQIFTNLLELTNIKTIEDFTNFDFTKQADKILANDKLHITSSSFIVKSYEGKKNWENTLITSNNCNIFSNDVVQLTPKNSEIIIGNVNTGEEIKVNVSKSDEIYNLFETISSDLKENEEKTYATSKVMQQTIDEFNNLVDSSKEINIEQFAEKSENNLFKFSEVKSLDKEIASIKIDNYNKNIIKTKELENE